MLFPGDQPEQEIVLDTKLYTMVDLEKERYRSFFKKLDPQDQMTISRDTALDFYRKSSLSEHEITQLYDLIKTLHLHPDHSAINETEFVTGMHFIVCMTKRNLAKLPSTFPKYLFPTLDLTPAPVPTPAMASQSISSMPSPDKDDSILRTGSGSGGAFTGLMNSYNDFSSTNPAFSTVNYNMTLSAPKENQIEKLTDSMSLVDLLRKESHNKQVQTAALTSLDQSEVKALQNMHRCLEMITENVEQLGYPVPATARSLDALDDMGNLLRKHVQSLKQEIQSMEISAKMLSVATERTASNDFGLKSEQDDPFQEVTNLTKQLVAVQQEAMQLYQTKENLVKRINDKTEAQLLTSATDTGSNFHVQVTPNDYMGSATAAPLSSSSSTSRAGEFGPTASQEVRNSESVDKTVKVIDPFDFPDSTPSPAAAIPLTSTTSSTAATPQDDFGWGSF